MTKKNKVEHNNDTFFEIEEAIQTARHKSKDIYLQIENNVKNFDMDYRLNKESKQVLKLLKSLRLHLIKAESKLCEIKENI